jgi:hypothetical protein
MPGRQQRLAAPRNADQQRDRVEDEAASEDRVEPVVARRESFHHDTDARSGRVRALAPSRSRTVETTTSSTSPSWEG